MIGTGCTETKQEEYGLHFLASFKKYISALLNRPGFTLGAAILFLGWGASIFGSVYQSRESMNSDGIVKTFFFRQDWAAFFPSPRAVLTINPALPLNDLLDTNYDSADNDADDHPSCITREGGVGWM